MAEDCGSHDLITRLRDDAGRMTPKMRAIADLALTEPERFVRSTSRSLCDRLGTSEPTLIRFCRGFGHSGVADFRIDLALSLARQPRRASFVEPLAHDRRTVNAAAKRRIAERAAGIVEGDRAILVDNGSTAELFAASLGATAPLTVMTTGLMVAQNALLHGRHEVMLTGGRVRPGALSMTGRQVAASLERMRFDTFVMGADSVDPARGLSTFLEDEAHDTRAMLEAAARVVVLADRTKFAKPSLHKICDLDRVAILVTDLPEEAEPLVEIRARGVRVVSTGAAATRGAARRTA